MYILEGIAFFLFGRIGPYTAITSALHVSVTAPLMALFETIDSQPTPNGELSRSWPAFGRIGPYTAITSALHVSVTAPLMALFETIDQGALGRRFECRYPLAIDSQPTPNGKLSRSWPAFSQVVRTKDGANAAMEDLRVETDGAMKEGPAAAVARWAILALKIVAATPCLTDVDLLMDCQLAVALSSPKPQPGQFPSHALTCLLRTQATPSRSGYPGAREYRHCRNKAVDPRAKELAQGASSPLVCRIALFDALLPAVGPLRSPPAPRPLLREMVVVSEAPGTQRKGRITVQTMSHALGTGALFGGTAWAAFSWWYLAWTDSIYLQQFERPCCLQMLDLIREWEIATSTT
ncbi:hypothetical protein B0H19DRAFT_1368950 [Mycena capillaripes]|nr:hypothetical protein B0H19DRAFT_1368950 [Mycena capillaripes]